MILNKDSNYLKIEPGYKQIFKKKFTLTTAGHHIIKMKHSEVVTDRDLEISKFLFDFTFATSDQIVRYLKVVCGEEYSEEVISRRLEILVEYQILNSFILSKNEALEETPEALKIYCLDVGGRHLLSHYSSKDTFNWYTTRNLKSSEMISEYLTTVNFYLSVFSLCKDRLIFFNANPEMNVGGLNIIPSFEMCIENNGCKNFFIGEVVKTWDFPIHFRKKIMDLEILLNGKGWKKYYYDAMSPPVLFLIAGSDELALETSKMTMTSTKLERFRATTDKRIEKPINEKGAFLRYSQEDDLLEEITTSIF